MEGERERIFLDQLRKAKSSTDRDGVLRRETLQKLIRLTHNPSPQQKVLAAGNIQYFFKDFPQLEEQAINAVYDLCEDQSPQVRIEGYKAIADISRTEKRWVKRNADVLLQLLQSDEPDEVSVVKKALIEHLDMDQAVTLGVLCDQLSPIDDAVDEEEKSIRARLQSLVLDFLLGDASFDGALSRLDYPTVEHIVKDLILALPSFQFHSDKGEALLKLLLDRAALCIRDDLKATKPVSLTSGRPCLELAQSIVLKNKIASPLALLQYYCSSLTGKIFIQQLDRADQLWIVSTLADILLFCHQNTPGDNDILIHQWKIVDACPYLLEVLFPTLSEQRSSTSCIALLRTCLHRKNSQQWTVSPNLSSVLTKLKALVEKSSARENKREIQKMIMFLMPSSNRQPPSTPETGVDLPQKIFAARQPPLRRPSSQQLVPEKSDPVTVLPPAKKHKTMNNSNEVSQGLSLLSRLQSAPAATPKAPVIQGLSIKGAASMSKQEEPRKPVPQTLLGRLQGVALTSPSEEAASPFDSRKRKRGSSGKR